eukprot:jgi/Ulvmu1/6921/UM031_0129.1
MITAAACCAGEPAYAELCSNVSVSDGNDGNQMCLPKSGNLTFLSFSQAREMKSYISCIGEASESCEQIRGGLYSFLGCAACGEVANAAALVEGACMTVFGDDGTKELCDAAGDAAPTADARAVVNATGVALTERPPNSNGVNVPLLGGPPDVSAAADGPAAATAPAPAPAAASEEQSEVDAGAPDPTGAAQANEASPVPPGAIQQDGAQRAAHAAHAAGWTAVLAAVCAWAAV